MYTSKRVTAQLSAVALICGASLGILALPAGAAIATQVDMGTAAPFAVLGASKVTNVPTSKITGDVGLSPAAGSYYAGLSRTEVSGSIYAVDASGPLNSVNDPALLTQAQNDLTTAYTSAAGQSPTSTFNAGDNQLGGKTLTPGVYAFTAASTANITASSPLVLNGNGVFIFQASSSLVTASGSSVQLENGAQACHVFWVVPSSATLGSSSAFVGTLMAHTSATLNSGATVQGRILAQTAAVTLDNNTITVPSTCAAVTVTTTPTTTPTTPTTAPTVPTTAPTTLTTTPLTPTTVIPHGSPPTGHGGAAQSDGRLLLGLGAVALLAAGVTGLASVRRRQVQVARVDPIDEE